LRHQHPRVTVPDVFYGCMAILTVAIGSLSLVDASPLRQIVESWINIHLLFELFLFTLVLARYRRCVQHLPRMTPIDIQELSRHLSRIVYLVLYGVIGFREIVALVNSISHAGAVDFNLFDERFRNGPDSAVFNPRDDLQVFFASGLLALFSVRALAYRLWLHISMRPPSKAPLQRPRSNALIASHFPIHGSSTSAMSQDQLLLLTEKRRREAVDYATAPMKLCGFKVDALTQERARLYIEGDRQPTPLDRFEVGDNGSHLVFVEILDHTVHHRCGAKDALNHEQLLE
jgi:hypothetical protein